MKKSTFAIIILIVLRVIISFWISDGKMKSDGITYTGILVNIEKSGSLSAIVPENEEIVSKGLTYNELKKYLFSLSNYKERILHVQWLHPILYAPFIFLYPSLYTIIFINNLLFIFTGFLLFRSLDERKRIISWILLLYFPPFLYLTNNFYSEALFIFLLSVMVTSIQNTTPYRFGIAASILIVVTRPIGAVYSILFCFFMLLRKQFFAGIIILIGIFSMVIVDSNIFPTVSPNHSYFSLSLAQSMYLSNTPSGNGDVDFYLANPLRADEDSIFSKSKNKELSSAELIGHVFHQIFENLKKYAALSINKTVNMFFGVIPDSWIYGSTIVQSYSKKIIWFVLTGTLWLLIFFGMKNSAAKSLYGALLSVTIILYFFIAARYRYLLPLVAIGIPFASTTVNEIFKKLKLLQ